VDATLLTACLHRVLAQVEITESNSMIEAFWRSMKHSWLYLNSLDNIQRLRSLVEFFVASHNAEMPHAAFRGQTPDEVFFGTAAGLPEELAKARRSALEASVLRHGTGPACGVRRRTSKDPRTTPGANQSASCGRCAPAAGSEISP
jgi:putative transposase